MRSFHLLLLCSSTLLAQQPPRLPSIEMVQQALGIAGEFAEIPFRIPSADLKVLEARSYRRDNVTLQLAILPQASEEERAAQLSYESAWERQRQTGEIELRNAPAAQRELARKESAALEPVIRFADGRHGLVVDLVGQGGSSVTIARFETPDLRYQVMLLLTYDPPKNAVADALGKPPDSSIFGRMKAAAVALDEAMSRFPR
jgi:hypothetical protein